ncbi:MAG: class I SAM-dependent methyltransferase [Acidimicrobiia bacterium]|nr:class I SAM-dependent methyltransferase [Acidimicrobiia bacterium]
MDVLDGFKTVQREGWSHFAPMAALTTVPAARLVRYAGVQPADRVLDVACGTGVVAITAARIGAHVIGLDLTPSLLSIARDNAALAGVTIEFREGDCETLPFEDASFDVVVSQYGHIFAPRPAVATAEMLRVLKRGGTLAFSTWPPELFVGRLFTLVSRYASPPPTGVEHPSLWGDPAVVRDRLGAAVTDLRFDRDTMVIPSLSPQHSRDATERTAGPVVALIQQLREQDPRSLDAFRREYEALTAEYWTENTMRQGYLLTRATKA